MASYTIELKDVVSHHNIFAFQYPFYDEKKRREFEQAFIRHFYFREICHPSIDRFMFYLEDKMNTVFPYYNELLNTAQIEYSVLDNYNVTETFERKYENIGKVAGVSSTVGQVMDEQKSEGKGNSSTVGTTNSTDGFTESVQTEELNTGTVDKQTTGTGMESKTTDNKLTHTNDKLNKFLDTPQGQLDLSNAGYLTSLTNDTENGNSTDKKDEKVTSNTGGTEVVNEEGEKTSETTHSSSRDTSDSRNEQTDTETSSTFEGNQRSTQDNNTRTESVHDHREEYTMIKKGNIGVDTDADMIQKHINLQQVLSNIQKMFFDECEDLFMMVY